MQRINNYVPNATICYKIINWGNVHTKPVLYLLINILLTKERHTLRTYHKWLPSIFILVATSQKHKIFWRYWYINHKIYQKRNVYPG